ncbi:MAG TPA: hypothetical protein DDZ89_18280 [Clostridiales bacterium]|nr:hypothetical protein [Clostridiales bacterium]
MKSAITIIRILFLVLFFALVAIGKPMLWFVIFGLSLLAALLFGRVYCGYVCPMNTVMIPVYYMTQKLKIKKFSTPAWLKSGWFSWVMLVISVLFMIISRRFLKINLPILLIWLMVSVLLVIPFHPSMFHNTICPFGALQRLFGKAARFSKNVDREKCFGCKKCEKVCPTQAIVVQAEDKKAAIDKPICLQCNECQLVCPKKAIPYGNLKINT